MIASIPSRFRDMNLVVKLPAFMVGLVGASGALVRRSAFTSEARSRGSFEFELR